MQTVLVCAIFVSIFCPPAPGAPPDAQGWVSDLELMTGLIVERHPNPFAFGVTRDELLSNARRLRGRMPKLNNWERVLGMAEMIAALNEGHTRLVKMEHTVDLSPNPIRLRRFSDGWRLMKSSDGNLLGARVVQIGDTSIEKAVAMMGRYIPADNEFYRQAMAGEYLIFPEALETGSLAKPGHGGRIVVEDDEGERHTLMLRRDKPDGDLPQVRCASSDNTSPANNTNEYYWYRQLDGIAYVRFNVFLDAQGESFEDFCHRLERTLQNEKVRRLVLDLRSNEGGDGRLMRTFLHLVIRNQRYLEPGRLVVLIGPGSFSAAVSLGVLLERHAQPWFVGEPTGGRPNGHGNPTRVTLPNTRLVLQCSAVYVRLSDPSDRRPCIWPHVTVEPSFSDCQLGRDAAFEAAIHLEDVPPIEELLSLPNPPNESNGRAGAAAYDELRNAPRWRYRDFESDLLRLAEHSRESGDAVGEMALLDRAVRDFGYSSEPHTAYAAALERSGELEEALTAYEAAFRRYRGDRKATEGLTRLRKTLGRPLVPEVLGAD